MKRKNLLLAMSTMLSTMMLASCGSLVDTSYGYNTYYPGDNYIYTTVPGVPVVSPAYTGPYYRPTPPPPPHHTTVIVTPPPTKPSVVAPPHQGNKPTASKPSGNQPTGNKRPGVSGGHGTSTQPATPPTKPTAPPTIGSSGTTKPATTTTNTSATGKRPGRH